MSRDLTTDFKNGITAGTVQPIIMTVAEFDSETLRFWNGIGSFSYGGDTYTGAGVLLKVTEVTETQNVEARGASFELSGIPTALIAVALAEDYQDRPITQTFAALDITDGSVIADPFQFFSGFADVMSIEEGGKYSTIKLTAENDLIILARVNERRRTPEDQKLLYADDTFFDQVASLQSMDIVWGKNG
jgi:hypothetical protein